MRAIPCRSFLHFARVTALLGFLALASTEASAYQVRCEALHRPELSTAEQALKIEQVQSTMNQYMRLMGLSEIKHDPRTMDDIKVRLASLSPRQERKLQNLVRQNYMDVKNLKYEKSGPFKSFKRHLDLIISEKTDARGLFRKLIIEKQMSVESALNIYYNIVHSWTRASTKMTAEDLMLTAAALQEKYFAKETQEQSLQNPIVLYGSFANGRALARTSDLDFAVTTPGKEVEMKEADLLKTLEYFPFSEAQSHFLSMKTIHTLGYLNPIVVLVSKDSVIVRVYSSQLSRDIARNPQFDEYFF